MGILIDIILIAVVILSVWRGVKHGFVRSVMNIITFIAALLCGWYFTPYLASFYHEKFLLNKLSSDIYNAIDSLISSGIESINLPRLFADKPDAFLEIIERYGADIGSLEQYFNSLNGKTGNITADISTRIAEPVSTGLSGILAFFSIFLLVILILKLVSFILDLIFKLPVLNAFNRVAGFVLGSVCGLAYAWILAVIIIAALPYLGMLFPEVFSQNTQTGSVLLDFFGKLELSARFGFK